MTNSTSMTELSQRKIIKLNKNLVDAEKLELLEHIDLSDYKKLR